MFHVVSKEVFDNIGGGALLYFKRSSGVIG